MRHSMATSGAAKWPEVSERHLAVPVPWPPSIDNYTIDAVSGEPAVRRRLLGDGRGEFGETTESGRFS